MSTTLHASSATVASLVMVALSLVETSRAQGIVEWRVEDGGNGHLYQAVATPVSISWEAASAAAQAAGGHLATIASAAENAFVFSLVDSPQFWHNNITNAHGPYLGGLQPTGSPEPAGDWQWVTGEPWTYTNWAASRPDNHGDEQYLHYFSPAPGTRSPGWNDILLSDNVLGFVIEYDPVPAITITTVSLHANGNSLPAETLQSAGALSFAAGDVIDVRHASRRDWGNTVPDLILCRARSSQANTTIAWSVVELDPSVMLPVPSSGQGSDFSFRLTNTPDLADLAVQRPRLSIKLVASLVDQATGQEVSRDEWTISQSDLGRRRQEYVDHPLRPVRPLMKVPPPSDFAYVIMPGNAPNPQWAVVSQWAVAANELVREFALRDFPGTPAPIVTSYYRSPAYQWQLSISNARAARDTSEHMWGVALDFGVRDYNGDTRTNVLDWALLFGLVHEAGLRPIHEGVFDQVHIERY